MEDRVKEALRKANAIVATCTDPALKIRINTILSHAQKMLDLIEKHKVPCPTDLAEELEKAINSIDKLYLKKVAN